MRRRRSGRAIALAALLVAPAAACVDFIEPVGPAANQPTRINATLSIVTDSLAFCAGSCSPHLPQVLPPGGPGEGRAAAWFIASLSAGTDLAGDPRRVLDPTLTLSGITMPATDTSEIRDRWIYGGRWRPGPEGVPRAVLVVPEVEGASALEPALSWPLPWKSASDTISITRGEGLEIVLRVPDEQALPPPLTTFWNLSLTGQRGNIRIGADGLPPETLPIPAQFVPEPVDSIITARLQVTQATSILYTDYVVNFNASVSMFWIVKVVESDTAAATAGARR